MEKNQVYTCNPDICQFLEYIETPGEKYPGIAKVLMYNKVVVLFKWMPTKDGTNHFVSPPSFKIGEKYENAIYIDSRSENEAIERYIRYSIMESINAKRSGTKIQMTGTLQSKSNVSNLDDCPF